MKKLIILFQLCVILGIAAAASATDTIKAPAETAQIKPVSEAAPIKLASIDVRKVAQECKEGVDATKTLSKMATKVEADLKRKQTELEKIKAALEGKGKQLTPQERTSKEKDIRKKLEKYRETAEKAQKDLQAKEEELGGKIIERIDKTVKEYAPKNGFALVVRKNELIYSDAKNEVTDITGEILKLVDSQPPPAAK
jgi:Skp family chaperone for outer membrane proteins